MSPTPIPILFAILLTAFASPGPAAAEPDQGAGFQQLALDAWRPLQPWQSRGEFWETAEAADQRVVRLLKKPCVLIQDVPTDGSIARVALVGTLGLEGLVTDGKWGTVSAAVAFLDREGEEIPETESRKFFRGDSAGEPIEIAAAVPAEAWQIRAVLEYRAAAGTATFTDLGLRPLELREPPDRAAGTSEPAEEGAVTYDEHATWHRDPMQKPRSEWGAQLDPEAVQAEVHVDAAAAAGGDGSADKPFATIEAGLAHAAGLLRAGTATRLRIADGIYREHNLRLDGEHLGEAGRAALLVIEGESRDGVRIRASHAEGFGPEAWELVDAERNIYRLPWTRTELDPVPEKAWSPAIQAISRHRVMVFVDGELLTPVQLEQYRHEKAKEKKFEREHGGISTHRTIVDHYTGFAGLDAMQPGTMAVNTLAPGDAGFDAAPHPYPDSLLIRLPAGETLDSREVEVAWGGRSGLRITNKDHLVVRGLTVERMGIAALFVRNAHHVLVEDCRFRHNDGGDGATTTRLLDVLHLTLRDVEILDNGPFGLHLDTKFSLLERVSSCGNNWRGGLSDHVMHGNGGCSFHGSHVAVTDSRFDRNHGAGLRQDGLGEHVFLERCSFDFNQRTGVFFEITYGPVTFSDCRVVGNRSHGVHLLCVHGVTLEDTVIANNREAQLSVFLMLNRGKKYHPGSARFSGPTRWPAGGPSEDGYWIQGMVDTVIKGCTIAVTDGSYSQEPLLTGSYWAQEAYYRDWLTEQLDAYGNTWFHAGDDTVFDVGRGEDHADFAQWQAITGEDGDSRWAAPEQAFAAPVEAGVIDQDALPLHRQ